MEQQHENKNYAAMLFLLPRQYKFIGSLVTAIGLIGLFFKKLGAGIVLAGNAKKPDIMVMVLTIILITGLMTIAWTREKVEDEFTLRVRYKCMAFAFILAILYVIAAPIFVMTIGNIPSYLGATELVIGMLLVYLASFSFQKRGQKN